MKLTIHERDDETVEFRTGEKTLGQADLIIRTTPTGLYYIEARGGGASPKIVEERFTNLSAAKQGLKRYLDKTEVARNKRAMLTAMIERRKAKYESGER